MKMKYLIIIAILFSLTIVSAENITLFKSHEATYKTIPITYKTIGNLGSIILEVGNVEIKLNKYKPSNVLGLNISLIESNKDIAKISIIQNICLINSDCVSDLPCNVGTCNALNECIFKNVEGCPFGNDCKPSGTMLDFEGDLKYCSENLKVK